MQCPILAKTEPLAQSEPALAVKAITLPVLCWLRDLNASTPPTPMQPHSIFRVTRRVLAIIVMVLLLASLASGGFQFSAVELAASPYQFNIVAWEIANVPDKWTHKALDLLPWSSNSREEKREGLLKYFSLGDKIRTLEDELKRLQADGEPSGPGTQLTAVSSELDVLREQRGLLKADSEEFLESELAAILKDQGLASWFGGLVPPVDISLSVPPTLLVVSPRDRISRIHSILLKPDMTPEEMELLESKIFSEQDMSALVTGLGGVGSFPAFVRNSYLRSAAELAAHEWLHNYWFFHPLGWAPWSWTPELNSLNETAATIAGRELGHMLYESITGEELPDPVHLLPSEPDHPPPPPDPNRFDFNTEMRTTRLRVDELLEQGRVEQAEDYMEERRLMFMDNGYFLRKLNQAYFAFHGTYATGPASVSPIGDQVTELRLSSESLGDFIRTMSEFGSYQEFLDFLEQTSVPIE